MIGRLTGVLVSKHPPWLLIDVQGVGYELEAPMSTIYDLPELGQVVTLHTHYAQKEDSVHLYGFLREPERRMFREVQKVSGIGAKIALAILSALSAETFTSLIQTGDVTALTRVPGIGKKTAERMVLELRDRTSQMADFPTVSGSGAHREDPQADALEALQQLGYKPVEAAKMIKSTFEEGDDVATIIRKALKFAIR